MCGRFATAFELVARAFSNRYYQPRSDWTTTNLLPNHTGGFSYEAYFRRNLSDGISRRDNLGFRTGT